MSGRVLLEGAPAPGTRVFVYPPTQASPIGPGFIGAGFTDDEGRFSIGLAPGSYKVGVRRRAGGDTLGFLNAGDYRADVRPETVEVAEGSWLELGDLALRQIDPEKLATTLAYGFQEQTATVLEGSVGSADGSPRPGFFVLAYRNPEMMGRPDAVTEVRADGTYTLYLPDGGTYCLQARRSSGGAPAPGEPIGTVAGTNSPCLQVAAGVTLGSVGIVVGNGP